MTTVRVLIVIAAIGLLLAMIAFLIIRRVNVRVVKYAVVGEEMPPPPPEPVRRGPSWLFVLVALTVLSFLATLLLLHSHNEVVMESRSIGDGLNPGKSYVFTLAFPRTMYKHETKNIALSIAKSDMKAPRERPYVSWGDGIAAHAHGQGLTIDDADTPPFELSRSP